MPGARVLITGSMSDSPQAEPVNIYEFLSMMLESTTQIAWSKLGLQHDLATGQIQPLDLEQAKAAIDAADALAKIVEPKLDDEDRRTIQNLIRDLRVNYVQRSLV